MKKHLLFSLCLAALAVGCDDYLPGKPREKDKYERPEAEHNFAVLYRDNCAACHGAKGDFGPGPPLKDDLFRSLIPVAELEKLLNEGRSGTLMPGFALSNGGALTETQIQVFVHEIKGVGYRVEKPDTEAAYVVADGSRGKDLLWGEPEPVSNAPPLNAEGSAGDAKAGLNVWKTACAGCHGDKGQGGDSKPTWKINDPSFLALSSDRVLRRYIITGRPDLHMPDFRGKTGRDPSFNPLKPEDVANLSALLAQWRTGP